MVTVRKLNERSEMKKLPILEIIWTALMLLISYGLYSNLMSNIDLRDELDSVTKSAKLQDETIKQLQVDFLKVVELANKNAEAYEKVTKDTSSNKVQKVTISNLPIIKRNIKGRLNAEDTKINDNNISIELNRLWDIYKEDTAAGGKPK